MSQYVEREENTGRMREIGKVTKRHAPKEEEVMRYLPYGSIIKRMKEVGKATKRHTSKREEANRYIATGRNAQNRVENTTKEKAIDRVETNRFSQRRVATNRNVIERSVSSANHMEGECLPRNTKPMKIEELSPKPMLET